MGPVVISFAALLVIAGVGIWLYWFRTYHLAMVDKGKLFRDGNRGVREFVNTIRTVKPKTIVSLVDDSEIADREKPEFLAEIAYAKDHKLSLERIPIKLGGWPTSGDVKRFLDIACDEKKQPVLVHCAQGVRRTGMLVAAYQESILGYDKAKTKAEILRFGHSDRSIGDVKRFIDIYDPVKREVTQELPQGKE
jgi:protein tyrosine phosphatase (PTP) superfamily phosphohydrolase (DUF442 family)